MKQIYASPSCPYLKLIEVGETMGVHTCTQKAIDSIVMFLKRRLVGDLGWQLLGLLYPRPDLITGGQASHKLFFLIGFVKRGIEVFRGTFT